MKKCSRFIIVLLIICIFSILISCNKTQMVKEYIKTESYPHLAANFCKNGQVLYFMSETNQNGFRQIYYIDKETGTSGPLCGKPECRHDSLHCNSAVGDNGAGMGLSLYQNHLYFLADKVGISGGYGGKYLYSVDLDGSNRREIRKIFGPDDIKTLSANILCLCVDDFFVMCGQYDRIENGAVSFVSSAMAFSLHDETAFTILENDSPISSITMRSSQDQLFISVSEQEVRSEDEAWTAPSRVHLYRYEFTEKKLSELCDRFVDFFPWEIQPVGEKIYISTMSDQNGPNTVYSYDIKEAEFIREFEMCVDSLDCPGGIENGWICLYNYMGRSPYEVRVTVRDFQGNLLRDDKIATKMISPGGTGMGRAFLGCDEDYVYYLFRDYSGSFMREYVTGYSMADGKEKVLWDSENALH